MPKRGVELHDAVLHRLAQSPRGRVLDVGAGSGELARRLVELQFQTEACDCIPAADWRQPRPISYRQCDLNSGLPYEKESFDYVVCLEVIEHVDNPFSLCRELRRVLRKNGTMYISTPNILSLRSRVKFLMDGSFLYFDLPPIEWDQRHGRPNVHVHPIRFHELEYYLYKAGMRVNEAFTNMRSIGWKGALPLIWAINLYARHMVKRSRKKDRIPLARIYEQVLAEDLLYGTHLIVRADGM